ncbi:metallophosphoesterase [Paenibacillus terrigena]|uniref:metallophosphoesterase n=1 Tax=Paenibacillus terrigena TaxID=369333 RepID=UPI00036B7F4E|nr:metallophosphoesterase [Paenibacillus terrigena]
MFWVIIAIFILLIVFVLIRMIYEATHTVIQQEHIALSELPEHWTDTTFMFISDIHRRKISEEWVEALIVKHPQIELVLIGGDLTERGVPLERVRHNMQLLRKIAPMYAVHGNHDYNADYRQLDIVLRECGVQVLDNEAIWLEKEDQGVWLVGLDDLLTDRANLRLAFAEPRLQPAFTIMLVHDPGIIQQLHDEPIHLILAGHTHGGQFRLPGIGPLVTHGIYRQYSCGLYTLDRIIRKGSDKLIQVFISRGFGTSHLPLRLFCPAEVHIITLHQEEKQSKTP